MLINIDKQIRKFAKEHDEVYFTDHCSERQEDRMISNKCILDTLIYGNMFYKTFKGRYVIEKRHNYKLYSCIIYPKIKDGEIVDITVITTYKSPHFSNKKNRKVEYYSYPNRIKRQKEEE